jgi:hypothetical protein
VQRIGIHRPRIRRERPRHEVLPPGLDAPLRDIPQPAPIRRGPQAGRLPQTPQQLRTSRMRSRGYRVSDDWVGDMYDVLARHGGMRFLDDGVGFIDEHKRNAAPLGPVGLTAALGDDLIWNIVGNALDLFGPRQIRAARQRLPPALVRIHKPPGSHHHQRAPRPAVSLIRGLPQPGPDGPPSHPTSPDDLA